MQLYALSSWPIGCAFASQKSQELRGQYRNVRKFQCAVQSSVLSHIIHTAVIVIHANVVEQLYGHRLQTT